jgi:hypothetical protein
MLPVLGIGTALALTGWLWTGLAIIGAATLAPMLIKRSAAHFVMTQALEDAKFFEDALAAGVLQVEDARQFSEGANPPRLSREGGDPPRHCREEGDQPRHSREGGNPS